MANFAHRNRPDLKMEEKNMVGQFLLQKLRHGMIERGAHKEAALKFGISIHTVRKIWLAAKKQIDKGEPVLFEKIKRGTHKDLALPNVERIKKLTMLQRSSLRKMAEKLGVSKSTIGRWIKLKLLRPHINAIKPLLTETNKIARLKFSLSQLKTDCISENIAYQSMRNVVHIDEKWFYITKTSNIYYLLPEEAEPYRCCQSKRYLTKVMFMCAVCRPIICPSGEVIFDGKLGIFPFTEEIPAQRNSKNRSKGTMETKAIHSITRPIIKDCILNEVIPAIISKWPSGASKDIFIQQDNAKPHISSDDPDLVNAATKDGFNIKLISQPANSPDTNINDLGFFRAIQSLQDKMTATTVEDLVNNVIESYNQLEPQTLNNVFLSLQGCCTEIMKNRGGNNYKIPHMNKKKLLAMGILSECLEVENELVRDCLEYLKNYESSAGANYDLNPLKHAFGY